VADEIYRPVISDEDTESETPSPRAELDIPDPAEFRRKAGVDDADHLTTEEASDQRQRRQPDPESPESAYERPLVVHKVKGHGPISVNEAADAMRWGRGYKLGSELRQVGLSQSQLEEMAAVAVARGEAIEPLMPPPPEAKVLEHFGEDKKVLTPTEAANELTSWRARHQEAQQEALAELAGEAVAQAQQEAQQAEAQQAEAQQAQQPVAQPTERELVAAERQWITHLKRMEGHEAAARTDYDQLVAAVVAEFPSLQHSLPTPEQVENLRVRDPERFQKLAMADQMLRERQARIAFLAQQRAQHEQRQAQIAAQERAAARAKQDQQFEHLAAQHIPNWERVHGEVRAQARKTLESAGLSQADIQRLWTGDEAVDAHSSVLQLVLAKAAQWDLAQEKARQVRQTNLPQVIRPGTYRRASDGDAQSVGDLTARLAKATGREAIRLGTALTKARRAMNNGGR
jgi:hypothetical protein